MRFWSEGLGDSELVIDLERARIDQKGDCVALTGVVTSPAPWEYEVKIAFADWAKILDTATSSETINFVATHMRLAGVAAMGWWIARFVVLLALYRLRLLFGGARQLPATSKALEDPHARKA